MFEVAVRNEIGWAVQDLKVWRTEITGVVQIDARELLPNGRFAVAVLHFANEADAAVFEKRLESSAIKMARIAEELGLR